MEAEAEAQARAGSVGIRPVEATAVLGAVALRRLRLRPGATPPWLNDDYDFERAACGGSGVDVLAEGRAEWGRHGLRKRRSRAERGRHGRRARRSKHNALVKEGGDDGGGIEELAAEGE